MTKTRRAAVPTLAMPKVAHKRQDYDTRTGRTGRAAKTLAAAHVEKPTFNEDEDGNMVREWTSHELRSFTQADIAGALRRQVAIEVPELLGQIPLSAIKFAYYKGWIVKAPNAPYLLVTRKGQLELDLPKKTASGMTIRFYVPTEPTPRQGVGKLLRPLLPNVAFQAA